MALLLLTAGIVVLCLPGLARPLGRRLPADEWARLCGFALVGGAVTLELGTCLYAAPTVLRALGVRTLAMTCDRLLGALVPGGAPAGWAAASAAMVMPALCLSGALRSRRGCRRIWVEPGLGDHQRLGRYELVVLPTPQFLAISVAKPTGQIIVSQGMVEALRPEELTVVLGHEVAHLDHGHQRWLVAAAAIEHGLALLPPARCSVGALRTALERWADESATSQDRSRRVALRGALLRVTRVLVSPAAGFSAAESVIERLDALASAPPEPSWATRALVCLPGLPVASVILIAVGASVADARMIVAMAGRCLA